MSNEDNKPPLFFGERVIQNILMSGSLVAVLWVGNSVLDLQDKVIILVERGVVLRSDYEKIEKRVEDQNHRIDEMNRRYEELKYRIDRFGSRSPGGTSPVQFRPPTEEVVPRKVEEAPPFRNDPGRR